MIKKFNEFTINESAGSDKKFMLVWLMRDWKDPMSEVMPDVRKIMKKYPGLEYYDIDWNDWDDNIYTVLTNYKQFYKNGPELGPDLFDWYEHMEMPKDGVIRFNTFNELKKMVAQAGKDGQKAIEEEDMEWEELKKFGKKGEALKNKLERKLKGLHDMKDKEMKALGLDPNKKSGWSIASAAIHLALKELNK